jgi:hypothetical protein
VRSRCRSGGVNDYVTVFEDQDGARIPSKPLNSIPDHEYRDYFETLFFILLSFIFL